MVHTRDCSFASAEAMKSFSTITIIRATPQRVWRIFILSPRGDGEVEFSLRLEFSGLMASLITKTIPDLQLHLDEFAAALKQRAEQA